MWATAGTRRRHWLFTFGLGLLRLVVVWKNHGRLLGTGRRKVGKGRRRGKVGRKGRRCGGGNFVEKRVAARARVARLELQGPARRVAATRVGVHAVVAAVLAAAGGATAAGHQLRQVAVFLTFASQCRKGFRVFITHAIVVMRPVAL